MNEGKRTPRFGIAGGGTGGHLFPAIAVAEEILRRWPEAELHFFSTDRPGDRSEIGRYGWNAEIVEAPRWKGLRAVTRQWVRDFLRSFARCSRTLRRFPCVAIVASGGYPTVPVVLAAWLEGIPVFLLEQNAVPGKANRLLVLFAKALFAQWEASQRHFLLGGCLRHVRAKIHLTGNPLRQEVVPIERQVARAVLGVPAEKKVILLFGGSLGAQVLNRFVLDAVERLARWRELVSWLHVAGCGQASEVERAYRRSGLEARVFEFSRQMPLLYAASDLVICRAGGTSLAEIAALGKPSVLIPYALAADNHQYGNASEMVRAGAAQLLTEQELYPERWDEIIPGLLLNEKRLRRMAEAAWRFGRPDAARRIGDLLETYLPVVGARHELGQQVALTVAPERKKERDASYAELAKR